ncbi:peptidyl-tRNA hydrolase [Mycena metata]|uniref:peptidyl-tRNA hydrolase n=1 Tax=Mycena metata TaxID=1033252 RepID=A0AAD7JCP6_9AGAR|nr:peptidyl-tRNA hydrolase [Mycena metata]
MAHLPRLLVAGLGNLPFPNTRHSLGQLIIDELAGRTGIRMSSDRDGFLGESTVTLGSTPLVLMLYKSKHLMNVSGPSIAAACRKRGLSPDMLITTTRVSSSIRRGGSANGHNGIKSVIGALGSQDFHRLRVGVGRHNSMDLSDYVLGRLSSHERQFWSGDGVDLVCDAIEKVAKTVKG